MRVIIDTDPGIDDSVALALAVRSPEIDIAAITTTYGNAPVADTTRNAREVLARLGAEARIPVYPGADRPLLRSLEVALDTHGVHGIGYVAPTLPHDELLTVDAPQVILRLAAASQQPLTLVALGPLTNLALALALDRPLLREQVAEIVLMGGEPNGYGNITPVSEFNIWCDPEAAEMVLHSGIPIRMVGLNVTRRMVCPSAAVAALAQDSRPELKWWGDMLRFYEEFHRRREGLAGCILNDPLAIALAFAPELGTAAPMHVDVMRDDGLTRGQTVCDRHGFLDEPPNARVYLDVHSADVLHMINTRVWEGAVSADALLHGMST